MTDLELAYLAGLLDGEGSFVIPQSGKQALLRPVVILTMTNVEIVEWVAGMWESSCNHVKRKNKPDHHKEQYTTHLKGKKAIVFCEAVLPYLRLKKPQAQVMIDFKETYNQGNPLPEWVKARREELRLSMKELNADTRFHPMGGGRRVVE